jgi:hypothetical protein
MKKLFATLALILPLLFGSLAFAPITAAGAADACSPDNPGTIDFPCGPPVCTPDNPGTIDFPCAPVPDNPVIEPCPTATSARDAAADVSAELAAVTARADRLQSVADRRATTIKRLKAKIRKLR